MDMLEPIGAIVLLLLIFAGFICIGGAFTYFVGLAIGAKLSFLGACVLFVLVSIALAASK